MSALATAEEPVARAAREGVGGRKGKLSPAWAARTRARGFSWFEGGLDLVFAVVNQKGGVGKTTTSVNLAACLGVDGLRVLVVDLDPQGNATSGFGVDKSALQQCVYDLLVNDAPVEELIRPSVCENVDLIPATINLAGAEVELVAAMSREWRLRRGLAPVRDRYQVILIDSPPSLSLLTLNALAAADRALVPIQCEYYALEGISQLLKTLTLVKQHLNRELSVGGVVLTMHDPRVRLTQQVAEEVRRYFGDQALATVIPRNVRLSEAPSHGIPVNLYDSRSRGSEAYRSLARELTERFALEPASSRTSRAAA
jgi:chromosome partitioning protein